MINEKTIKALRDAIEKCGGPGGTPGPCAGPRQPKKPPKKPAKPTGAKPQSGNRRFTEREQRLWDEAKKKPPKKPKTLEEAVMPHFDEIQKSRKKVYELSLKLGFKPTSKDKDVAVQQAMEWAQVRAAKKVLGEDDGGKKPSKKPAAGNKPAPKKPKLPVTEPGKKKPPKDPVPPKKPGKRPVTDPKTGKTSVAKKTGTVDDITNEAKSIIELSKSPETRRVDVGHPTIARLAGRSFSKVVQTLAGMKPSEIWPNRRQAAKNLVEKFKKEFTDENAEALIQTAASHVKKVFTKEGAAGRILSHFLKEQPW